MESAKSIFSGKKDVPYFVIYGDSDKYGVMDLQGNVVVEPAYDQIELQKDAAIVTLDKNKGVVDYTGEKWCECKYKYIDKAKWDGYYIATGADDKYSLISSEGVVVEGVETMDEMLTFTDNNTDKDECNVFVLSDKSFSLKTQNKIEQCGLFCFKDSDSEKGLYGFFETVSGKQLLDYDYDEIHCVGDDYIYALHENEYTIYKKVIS